MPSLPPPEQRPLRLNFAANSRGSTAGLQPELLTIIPRVESIFRFETGNVNFSVHINAGQEWHNGHKLFSLHHTGFAIDFQTLLLPGGGIGHTAQRIERSVREALGPRYRVELEHHPPHLHVELRAGLKVSNPGDFPEPKPGIG